MGVDVEQLYRRYWTALVGKCARMLRDPSAAEDLAQETFVRLWKSRERIDEPEAVLAWLYRTSTRLAIDRMRRDKRKVAVADLSPPSSVDEAVRAEHRDLLASLAAEVPADELEVALLSRVDGMTHDEIGLVTQRSGRTVRRLLKKFDERVGPWKRQSA